MKIVMATGGSGGHIFPALNVARELKIQGHEVVWVGVFGVFSARIKDAGFFSVNLSARGISFASWSACCRTLGAMAKAMGESWSALKKIRPDAVAGFGGYGAFPVILAAAGLRYPTLIHEQNVVPGKANRVLSYFVDRIALTFPESRPYFPPHKTAVTGCPCHAREPHSGKEELRREFCLDRNKPTILVLGGSQGSRRINAEFMQTLGLLRREMEFQVIHISGKNDAQDLKNQYREQSVQAALFEFLDDMGKAYGACDVIAARAGASTILEIAKFKLPAVLIPYPFAGGHQKENALLLCRTGQARMIEEKDLTPGSLARNLVELLQQKSGEKKKQSEELVVPDAAGRIAREIISLKR